MLRTQKVNFHGKTQRPIYFLEEGNLMLKSNIHESFLFELETRYAITLLVVNFCKFFWRRTPIITLIEIIPEKQKCYSFSKKHLKMTFSEIISKLPTRNLHPKFLVSRMLIS